jgi:hypothetical protein
MFRYLSAAFTARPRVPGLGAIPVNLLALAGFGIVGLANPAFWFLGLGLEAAYLFGLASNSRFREIVDARTVNAPPSRPQSAGWEQLVGELGGQERSRCWLKAKLARHLAVRSFPRRRHHLGAEPRVAPGAAGALRAAAAGAGESGGPVDGRR